MINEQMTKEFKNKTRLQLKAKSLKLKAFTLLELLLVIAIIAVLAGIIMFSLNPAERIQKANNTKRKADVDSIKRAINTYGLDNGGTELDLSICTNTICEICSTTDVGTCTTVGKLNIGGLIGTQLSSIPLDPREGSRGVNGTGYFISKTGEYTKVIALGAELGEVITSDGVTRSGTVASVTFTPNVAKRNSTGPFAAGVMVQTNQNVDPWISDAVYFSHGNNISKNFRNNIDFNQGSIVFWITPEWNGNDGLLHYFLLQASHGYVRLFKNTSNQLVAQLANSSASVDASSWTAGSTYLVVARWDTRNKLNGTNYVSLSVGDSHTFGGTSISDMTSFTPGGFMHFGSYDAASSYRYGANAIIEGLTIYRRPLFDGTYGIDVGNGDEIAQIYNSGNGQDPTLITGSWDVVFALPTNASIGTIVTGTGNAWSHPHSSNLLYTDTTNTGGFMMNGTPSNDGWSEIPWYKVGGASGVVAVYQPIGATDIANSYVNRANPGTYNASPVVAPTWDATNGWTFNGTTQYLDTGVIPSDGWSMIIRWSNLSGYDRFSGIYEAGNNFYLSPQYGSVLKSYGHGNYNSSSGALTSGVMAVAGDSGYLNGNLDAVLTPNSWSTIYSVWIGAANGTYPGLKITGRIQAVGLYSSTLSSTQVTNVTSAMQNLSSSGTYLTPTALGSTEKIFAGGYKFISNGGNQGIYRTFTATSGGDYVLRALGHSDGTCNPKIQITRADGTTVITSLAGTTTSTRTAPNVYIFTWESPAAESEQVQLINTAASGTCYWHQVEVISNLVSNPSFENGSGDPWIPTGWSNQLMVIGDTSQELSIIHSGNSSLRINPVTHPVNACVYLLVASSVDRFVSMGGWFNGINPHQFKWGFKDPVNGGFPQYLLSGNSYLTVPSNSSWKHTSYVGRVKGSPRYMN